MTSPGRSRRAWRLLLVLLAAVVGVTALMPAPPETASLGWDKLNHLAAFAALALCAVFGWRDERGARLAVLLVLLAYGGAIELLQLQVPNRSAEWADLLADAIGIAVGALLAAGWLRLWAGRNAAQSPRPASTHEDRA